MQFDTQMPVVAQAERVALYSSVSVQYLTGGL